MLLGNCLYCNKEFRKREKSYKFCSLTCSARSNKNGLRLITLPKPSQKLAEFIGICLGDGNTSKYQTGITLNSVADKDYIPYVINLSRVLFPEAHISIVHKKEQAVEIRIYSVLVATFLQNMGIASWNKKIPEWIIKHSSYKYFCIRGLIDTEGSVSTKKYLAKCGEKVYYQLNFRCYDKDIMKFVRDALCELKLKPTMSLTKSLYISNPVGIMRYRKEVGFSNPKLSVKLAHL